MKYMEFEVGDKVSIKKGYINEGLVGRICYIEADCSRPAIGVQFKNWKNGHDCHSTLKNSSEGWFFDKSNLELTNKELTIFKKN